MCSFYFFFVFICWLLFMFCNSQFMRTTKVDLFVNWLFFALQVSTWSFAKWQRRPAQPFSLPKPMMAHTLSPLNRRLRQLCWHSNWMRNSSRRPWMVAKWRQSSHWTATNWRKHKTVMRMLPLYVNSPKPNAFAPWPWRMWHAFANTLPFERNRDFFLLFCIYEYCVRCKMD